ncbi:MAG TPA: response regulator, partial [Gemmatimonadales bacterium]|nr:response regulator [Gemmatimonadales bacterium]
DVPNPGRGARSPGESAAHPAVAPGITVTAGQIQAPAPRPEQLLEDLELIDDSHSGEHTVPAKRATVLLVEDEDTLRRVMRDLLEQEGYLVHEAGDGAEALEMVDRFAPDAVLLDLNLPNVDGYTVLAQLRSREATRNLPILVVSARGDEDNEVRVLRLGATDFLTKPFRPRALSARLEATLARIER